VSHLQHEEARVNTAEWSDVTVSKDGTHHVRGAMPIYSNRFHEVLKFHAPGYAPARDATGAFHIAITGAEAYLSRFVRTFGFYDNLAAVIGDDGWFHISPRGTPLYSKRFAWCGNYQEHRCAVRQFDGRYRHIDEEGHPVYKCTWNYTGDFKDGSAVVQREDGRSTHIDTMGRLIHGAWFVDLDIFHKRFARARDDDGWFHIIESGLPAYTARFSMVEPFYNGFARCETRSGKRVIIDEFGVVMHTIANNVLLTETI